MSAEHWPCVTETVKDPEKSEDTEKSADEELLHVAKERYRLADELWGPIFKDAESDLEFLAGHQWSETDRQTREDDGRPCLTINRLPQYTRQVVNDQRQNKPSIKVSPVDDQADVETAKIYGGLIRHIEQSSKADMAYARAFEGAVENSFGFFRIRTDYCNAKSFDQELIIDQIQDPFLVKFDPFFKVADGSDANWAFVESEYSKDDYLAEHGDSALGQNKDWNALGALPDNTGWVSDKKVRVCEYYCKEFEQKTLLKLSDGSVVDESEFQEGMLDANGQPIEVVASKTANVPVICHYLINAIEVLERTTFPGQYIPVIPVLGKEIIYKGRRIFESLIRHAKDPQRSLNYFITCETETIALQPKAPFIAAEGQIPKEYGEMWRTANRKNHSTLIYKPTDFKGNLLPAPQRQAYEAPVQAITNARMQASEDLKATTGMYDAALGARSQETSGIAIQRRANQTQTSNFHFVDNLSKSIRHCGRILVDAIPFIYDTARTARIIGDEGQEEMVKLNQVFEKDGAQKIYKMGVGQYDVSIDTGPSYATKRQEAVASMLDLTKAYPNMIAIAGDLMVKNMDWPGAQEISERLKKTLPPGISEDDKNKQQPIPPQVQQQMQAMDQMIHQLTEKLNEATEAAKMKTAELESKERIEFAKLENNLVLEQMKSHGEASNMVFAAELKHIQERLNLLDMNQPIQQDFNGQALPQAPMPNQMNQPTGGQSPGPYMGDQ